MWETHTLRNFLIYAVMAFFFFLGDEMEEELDGHALRKREMR
jgi:hypothetical protein